MGQKKQLSMENIAAFDMDVDANLKYKWNKLCWYPRGSVV